MKPLVRFSQPSVYEAIIYIFLEWLGNSVCACICAHTYACGVHILNLFCVSKR